MASTIPAFIDAYLVALRSAQSFDPDVLAIHDGPPMSDDHLDYFAVGYSDSEGGSVVDAQENAVTIQNGRLEEYTLSCQACALDGDGNMAAARSKAFAIREFAADVLAEDWTVGGVVAVAGMFTASVQQVQSDDGALCLIDLLVAVRITPV